MRLAMIDATRTLRRTCLMATLLTMVGALSTNPTSAQVFTNINPLLEFSAPSRNPAPTPASASPQQSPAATNSSHVAIRVLLEQAAFWRTQYQTDQAIESLSRVLQLDDANADALALLAQINVEVGHTQAANDALARLRVAHPNDPRIAEVQLSLRVGEIDQRQLAAARRLSSEGRASEAAQAYQKVFRGDVPPPGLAIEYYQTLGGSESGYEHGRDALARIVSQNPQELRGQLAFAQLQTFRDSSRLDGITRLEALLAAPLLAEQANLALRTALMWLPNDASSVPELDAYLVRNPNDAEIRAKAEVARNPPGKARQEAFDLLNKNRLADAEAGFQAALALDQNDKDALGGMGLVRQRQGRLPEARDLLGRAAQLDPSWITALRGASYEPGKGRRDDGAARAIAAKYARVSSLSRNGQSAQAEALLVQLMGRNGNWGNYLQLGSLQADQGKLATAETNLERAMHMNPQNPAALVALAEVLERENKHTAAQALLARAGNVPSVAAFAAARSIALRAKAKTETDPAERISLFQEAVAADPTSPWARLELARALDGQNERAQAVQVMADVITTLHPSKDQIQASLIYAKERNNYARAVQIIEFVPEKDRTQEMKAMQQQAALRADITAALARGNDGATRSRLLQIAARPDPTGTRAAEVAAVCSR